MDTLGHKPSIFTADINASCMQPDVSSRSHTCTPCSTVVEGKGADAGGLMPPSFPSPDDQPFQFAWGWEIPGVRLSPVNCGSPRQTGANWPSCSWLTGEEIAWCSRRYAKHLLTHSMVYGLLIVYLRNCCWSTGSPGWEKLWAQQDGARTQKRLSSFLS